MTPDLQCNCNDVMGSMLVFIDNEIDDSAQFNAIAFHLQDCPTCREAVEFERTQLNLIRSLLTRSCFETAPTELHDRIHSQLSALEAQIIAQQGFVAQTEIFTQYSRTEITVDGETQIIETTHEIRRDFPL